MELELDLDAGPGGGDRMQDTGQADGAAQGAAAQASEAGERARVAALARRARRRASLGALGLGGQGDRTREDAELAAILAATHPRQFWEAAKGCLARRCPEESLPMARAFKRSALLLRAALCLASRRVGVDGMGHDRALGELLGASLAQPGKSARHHELRVQAARGPLARISAGDLFDILSAPAMAGEAHAALALARMMPDPASPDPQERRRHTFGSIHFVGHGMQGRLHARDNPGVANALAVIHAQAHGLPAPKVDPKALCSNAFLWIVERARACAEAGRADAPAWMEAAKILVERCPKAHSDEACLPGIVGTRELRLAMEAAPAAQRLLSTHGRDRCLLAALQTAPAGQAGEIVDWADASWKAEPSPAKIGGGPMVHGLGRPAWALALLAGHAPDPAWMPEPGSERARALFKLPTALVRAAKDGSLCAEDLNYGRPQDPGAMHDAQRLLRGLGHRPKAASSKAAKDPEASEPPPRRKARP